MLIFNLVILKLSDWLTSIMAFPFEQLGWALRELSLMGRAGNAVSMTIYAALCLAPVYFLLKIKNKRDLKIEDSLLGLLTAILFLSLYLFINPEYIGRLFGGLGEAGLTIGKVILGVTVWSVIFAYAVLRVLRLSFVSGTDKLLAYAGVLLGVLSCIFVWAVFGSSFGTTVTTFSFLIKGNKGTESGLGLSYVFLVLRFIVSALPNLLNVFTVLISLKLLTAMA